MVEKVDFSMCRGTDGRKYISSRINHRKNKGGYERLLEKDEDVEGDTVDHHTKDPNMESTTSQSEKDVSTYKIKHDGDKWHAKSCHGFREMLAKCLTNCAKKSTICALLTGLVLLTTLLTCGLALLFFLKLSSRSVEKLPEKHDNNICSSPGCVRAAANLLESIDFSKDPCNDFFQFACGSWLKNNRIPDDKSVYNAFIKVDGTVKEQLRTMFEEDDVSKKALSIQYTKRVYDSCMDAKSVNALKTYYLHKLVAEIGGWPMLMKNWTGSGLNLTQLAIWAHTKFSMDGLVRLSTDMDAKNVTNNIITLDQIPLGLGRSSREYYLNQTAYHRQIKAYKKLLFDHAHFFAQDLQVEFDEKSVQAAIEAEFEFEVNLAKITVAEEDRRNSTSLYNRMTLKEFSKIFNVVNWREHLEATMPQEIFDRLLKRDFDSYEVIVTQPDYFQKYNDLLAKTDKRTLFNFIISMAVKTFDVLLDTRFEDANQEFREIFNGRKEKPDRWKICVSMALNMDMASGAMYVKKHFGGEDRTEALNIVKNLKLAFSEIVDELDWMDGKTKETAVQKAKYMIDLVGYPDFIMNDTTLDGFYNNMTYENATFLEMVQSVVRFYERYSWFDLLRSFERGRFRVTPAMVNAFYGPDTNSITFPAGILQPPFFHGSYPKYVNYGAMGSVIGHEITHGFDDQGSQYDNVGGLRNWWSPAAEEKFRSKTKCIIDQYSGFVVPEIDMHVNGKLTQGENIADNGGIKQALKAYQIYVKKTGPPEPRLPGLNMTNQQVFFASYAQFWCGKSKPETRINQLLTDTHSPEMFRIIGVLSNFQEFSKAFSCPVNSRMNPKKKCAVW